MYRRCLFCLILSIWRSFFRVCGLAQDEAKEHLLCLLRYFLTTKLNYISLSLWRAPWSSLSLLRVGKTAAHAAQAPPCFALFLSRFDAARRGGALFPCWRHVLRSITSLAFPALLPLCLEKRGVGALLQLCNPLFLVLVASSAPPDPTRGPSCFSRRSKQAKGE